MRSMAVGRGGRSPGDTKREWQLVIMRQFRGSVVISRELVRRLEEVFVPSCNQYNW